MACGKCHGAVFLVAPAIAHPALAGELFALLR